jgi:D-alanyl-D-alanine carboxypeptidase
MLTAVAVMQLAERESLGLDDPLQRWLPWIREAPAPIPALTIHQLLGHRGALSRDSSDGRFWDLDAPFLDAEAVQRAACTEGTFGAVDADFKYSNIGYALLGLVIEAVADRPYSEHVADHVLSPAGMTHSSPDLPGDGTGVARGHTGLFTGNERRPLPHVSTGALGPATGLTATTDDLCRFLGSLVTDERLLTHAGTRRLLRSLGDTDDSGSRGYALGFDTADVAGRQVVGHSGGFPGTTSRSWLDPRARLAVSVSVNAIDGPATALANGIVTILASAARNARDRAADGDALADEARRWAEEIRGRYGNLWGFRDLAILGDTLVVLDPSQLDPTQGAPRLHPVKHGQGRLMGGSSFGFPGETVRAERGETDHVEALWFGSARLQRVMTELL